MTGTLGTSAGSSMLHLVLCCSEKLGLSPLQVFWWQRTLESRNKTAASPVGLLLHTILLDSLDDAFSVGHDAKHLSGSIATCLHSIGQFMQHDSGVIPVMEIGTILKALRQHFELHCPS